MVYLIKSFNPSTYNGLLDIRQAKVNFESIKAKSFLPQLGNIFISSNLHETYGLTMMHNHFPMSLDEVLVESLNDDISVSVPWRVKGKEAQPVNMEYWKSFGFTEKQFAIPHTWKLAENGTVQAYEFYTGNQAPDAPPKEFVSKLYTELKTLGLENVFGLRLLHHPKDVYCIEDTTKEKRANIIRFIKKKPEDIDKYIEVVWIFTKNIKCSHLSREESIQDCTQHCSHTCAAHCAVHCSVHCGAHCSIHHE